MIDYDEERARAAERRAEQMREIRARRALGIAGWSADVAALRAAIDTTWPTLSGGDRDALVNRCQELQESERAAVRRLDPAEVQVHPLERDEPTVLGRAALARNTNEGDQVPKRTLVPKETREQARAWLTQRLKKDDSTPRKELLAEMCEVFEISVSEANFYMTYLKPALEAARADGGGADPADPDTPADAGDRENAQAESPAHSDASGSSASIEEEEQATHAAAADPDGSDEHQESAAEQPAGSRRIHFTGPEGSFEAIRNGDGRWHTRIEAKLPQELVDKLIPEFLERLLVERSAA